MVLGTLAMHHTMSRHAVAGSQRWPCCALPVCTRLLWCLVCICTAPTAAHCICVFCRAPAVALCECMLAVPAPLCLLRVRALRKK